MLLSVNCLACDLKHSHMTLLQGRLRVLNSRKTRGNCVLFGLESHGDTKYGCVCGMFSEPFEGKTFVDLSYL